jgi:hypothetical protein
MEKYRESKSGQNKFSDPVQTRIKAPGFVGVLAQSHAPKGFETHNEIPVATRFHVFFKRQSVFSPTAPDFYFFSPKPIL